MAVNTSKIHLFYAPLDNASTTDIVTLKIGASQIIIPKTLHRIADITNMPSLKGEPNMLDARVLTDTTNRQVKGWDSADSAGFVIYPENNTGAGNDGAPSMGSNDALEAISDDGKEYAWLIYIQQFERFYAWTGKASWSLDEASVDSVLSGTLTLTKTSDIFYSNNLETKPTSLKLEGNEFYINKSS